MRGKKLTLEKPSLGEDASVISKIHHRVLTNLQVIISLMNLQIGRTDDKRIVHPLEATLNRVKAIAAMHERSFATPDFATIHVGAYLEHLLRELNQTYNPGGGIQVCIETADLALDIRRAIPVGLISNELVANAFEHAFPNGRSGLIILRLIYIDDPGGNESEGSAALEVIDDGVGLPSGMDVHTVDSMSFELVRILTAQLHGRLDVKTGPIGTSYRITFPL